MWRRRTTAWLSAVPRTTVSPAVPAPGPFHAATDEIVLLPWSRDGTDPAPRVLHLVIAWLLDEPERVGQCARLDRPCRLGRGGDDPDALELIQLVRQRPGINTLCAPLATTAISRRQLLFTPVDARHVRVQCVGRRELRHDGVLAAECVTEPGDTLVLENTAVFVVELRPAVMPALRHWPEPDFAFGDPDAHGVVGESAPAWRLRDELAAAARSEAHVLVHGPSGVGKELAAAAIHELSQRRDGPLVARNAATLPSGLLDAELFGSARNYPNPGSPERAGLVGAADGGTLLLDEIGELPEEHQAHLLRVLDTGGEHHRLGEAAARRSAFRLIGATNRDPASLKHDFLARFGTHVGVPGLDARVADVPLLVRALLARIAARTPGTAERFFDGGDAARARLDPLLLERLLRHRYTLHTRELERLLRVAVATSPADYLAVTPELVAALRSPRTRDSAPPPSSLARDDAERQAVAAALNATGWNVTRAAEQLGMSRHALHRAIRKHGLVEEE